MLEYFHPFYRAGQIIIHAPDRTIVLDNVLQIRAIERVLDRLTGTLSVKVEQRRTSDPGTIDGPFDSPRNPAPAARSAAPPVASADAITQTAIHEWGEGYFTIDETGFVRVRPTHQEAGEPASSPDVVEELRRRGFRSPFLIRFPQILKHRVARIHEAFAAAIKEFDYPKHYQGVLPGQGEPAARRRRGAGRGERAAPLRARGREQGRARAGAHDDARTPRRS